MKRKVYLAILILGLFLAISLPFFTRSVKAEGENPLPADAVQEEELSYDSIEDFVEAHQNPLGAVSYAYIKDGEIQSQGMLGYSDLTDGDIKENDPETVFEWGEASQILVWVSLMQLYEEGKIDFDQDITAYLPEEYTSAVVINKPITVKQLMNHSTGFQENLSERYVYEDAVLSGLGVYMINNQPRQTSNPGLCVSYSEYGICLGALMVANVSGKTYEDYVKENIFDRLGMDLTSVCSDQRDNERVKELYKKSKSYEDGYEIGGTRLISPYYPANMTIGTVGDYARLNLALLDETSGLFKERGTYAEFLSPTLYYRNSEIPRISHGLYHYDFRDSVIGVQNSSGVISNVFYLDLETKEGYVAMTNMYGESDYTRALPKFLFGEYEGNQDNGSGLLLGDFEGIYVPAGTISKGKLSFYSLFSTKNLVKTSDGGLGIKLNQNVTPYIAPLGEGSGVMEDGRVVHLAVSSDGVHLIQLPEMDLLTYPKLQHRFGYMIFILQVVNYAFSTLVLTVAFFRFLYMKIKKQEEPRHPFRKYMYIQCGNVTLFTWVFLVMFFLAISYTKHNVIDATSYMYYVGALVSVGYLVLLFQKKRDEELSMLEKSLYYATGAGGLILVVFSVFFRLIFGL